MLASMTIVLALLHFKNGRARQGAGGLGSHLKGTEFQFGEMKAFWRSGSVMTAQRSEGTRRAAQSA